MKMYTNPVLDLDFPDPAVMRAADGRYYAYATQTLGHAGVLNIQASCSDDLVHWSDPIDALPVKPNWARTTQQFWAPCVDQRGSTYVMYYAAQADDGNGQCLGTAVATEPLGPFIPSPAPLVTGNGFVNIDPMAFDDPHTGAHYLYWGSGFEPIKVQELATDRLHFRSASTAVDLIVPCATTRYERLVEGAFIHYHAPYYYLFYSGDDCFSPDGSYAVLVARSHSPTGPFETRSSATGTAHSAILEPNARWGVPGHNCIVTDAAGQDWIVYHAVDLDRDRFGEHVATEGIPRVMCIDRVEYRDGWSCVGDGTPSTTAQAAPITLFEQVVH